MRKEILKNKQGIERPCMSYLWLNHTERNYFSTFKIWQCDQLSPLDYILRVKSSINKPLTDFSNHKIDSYVAIVNKYLLMQEPGYFRLRK